MACSRSAPFTSEVGRIPSSAAPKRPPRTGRKRKRMPSCRNSTGPGGAAYTSSGIPGRRHAGRRPTSVTSWWRLARARARARACASEPPTVERSFFAITTRMASRNLGERLADVSVGVSERSGVRLLDAVDHEVPVPLFTQLRRTRAPHPRTQFGVVEQALDRARDIVGALADAETVDVVGDHLAERRDVTADDRALVQPGLEVAETEGLVQRRHGEHITGV